MTYMNVTEVESAIKALSMAHPTLCELIPLPNTTAGGRKSNAVRLGTKPANTVDTYYITGGVHAREWGSCEILVNLATDLCDAYAGGTGIGYGGKYFSAAEVKAVMEQINIIIFPCVNPDGRDYSQNTVALWRKNRNDAYSGGDSTKIGVDINRNQDFLWDFATAFAPSAINDTLASSDPASYQFHGPSAASEAESKNINYIHDTYTRIRWYVDVHSYSEDILFSWGDDEGQFHDASQSFTNHAHDGERGLIGDSYAEYIPDADLSTHQRLGTAFQRALGEVRDKLYVVKPAFSLYPVSGANDDWAYSRHYTDPSKPNTTAFTVEWGTTFQPAWTEMTEIIKDVSAGLLALGLEAIGIDSYIVTNRDTFSEDEVKSTSSFPESFYVVVDGMTPHQLGLPSASPAIKFFDSIGGTEITKIKSTPGPVTLELPGALDTPQRISFTFSVDFVNTTPFTAETRTIYLQATIAGLTDVAPLELLQQPNPYMVDGATSWLSTDVRVFQLEPTKTVNSHSSVHLGDLNADSTAAITYIRAFIDELRLSGGTPAPAFEAISQDETGVGQLELSRTVTGKGRVCNFAVAKVRYRGKALDASAVRVFFRTFNTMVSDLTYTTNPIANVQNYRRTSDGSIPLLGTNAFFSGAGSQITSIPYFAEKRVDTSTASMQSQHDDKNKADILHDASAEIVQYFGAWLDFNQTDNRFPVDVPLDPTKTDGPYAAPVPIPTLIRGIHQCLVAEVRFQPGATDPIPNGASPGSSDRLAQRNLSIVESDNPGTAETHAVAHTLLVKPSRSRGRNDELVIRWNDVPDTATASLYFPEWSADEVIALAAARGGAALTKIDLHTVGCAARGVTYIPIPQLVDKPTPGLMTVQLPLGVREGQKFHVDVQQHTGDTKDLAQRERQPVDYSARHVLGAFRTTILVQAGEPLLAKQVRNLAVLKYIHASMRATDPWHSVFVRYIAQLVDKVRGLGVDPDLVPPSIDDPGIPVHGGGLWHTGKIAEVIFDCFGEPEGFILETCGTRFPVRTTERRMAKLAWRACRERVFVSVRVASGPDPVVRELRVLGHR